MRRLSYMTIESSDRDIIRSVSYIPAKSRVRSYEFNDVIRLTRKTFLCLMCALILLIMLMFPGAAYARVVEVQKDTVNIRQGTGTNTAIVGKSGKGKIYAWTGASGDWTKISFSGGKSGYIRNDLLKAYESVEMTGSSVRVRKSPSLKGAVLGSVNKGDILAVSDYQDGWYKVSFKNADGWVSAEFARLAQAASIQSIPILQAGLNGTAPLGQVFQAAQTVFSALTEASDRDALSSRNAQTLLAPHDFSSATVTDKPVSGSLSAKVITIDPGHGSVSEDGRRDPGARGALIGLWENDINLDVALKLKFILESYGATVWMTHEGQTNLSLYGRAALANQNGSHIFISIHANASDNAALNGHSVYYYAPILDLRLASQRPLRQNLAKRMLEGLTKMAGRESLGVRESAFIVLKETNCPSVLVETAFLSHGDEEELLARGVFRQRLAEGLAAGTLKYFGVN